MRVFAVHDAEGRISQVITCPDSTPATLMPPPGLTMTEIKLPDDLVASDLENRGRLSELMENYRVEPASRNATLVRRGAPTNN